MAKHDPHLDLLFQALSDPTRRAILSRLMTGPAPVSELAEPTGMSLPTVMAHLAKLERGGLIRTEKRGRSRICHVEPAALNVARGWIDEQRAIWEARLDRLDTYATRLMKEREDDSRPED